MQKAYPLYRTAASTPGFLCQLDKDDVCHVPVTVFQATDISTGLKYCIGIAPEYVIIKGRPKAKGHPVGAKTRQRAKRNPNSLDGRDPDGQHSRLPRR